MIAVGSPRTPRLSARLFTRPDPKAVLVVVHGHGEHGGSYSGLAETLVPALGIDLLAFDFRGHGLSPGRRGVLRRYDDLLDDLEAAIDWASDERPGLPIYLLGHSNGGLAAIRFLETRRPVLSGLILSNPSLRLIAEAPLWKRAVGQVLLRVAPWVTLKTGISSDQLTQADDRASLIDHDPLIHRQISPPTYFGMVKHGPLAILEAGLIRTPTLLILGGADPITAPEAGRRFFDRLGSVDKTLRVYEAMMHEPIHEVDRDKVIAGIIAWLDERIQPGSPG